MGQSKKAIVGIGEGIGGHPIPLEAKLQGLEASVDDGKILLDAQSGQIQEM